MFFVSMSSLYALLFFTSLCPLSARMQPRVSSMKCLWSASAQLCYICCDSKYTWSLMGGQWLRNGWPGKTMTRHSDVGSFSLSEYVSSQVPLLFSECWMMHIIEMWSLLLLCWDFPLDSFIQSINHFSSWPPQAFTNPSKEFTLHRKRDVEYKVIAILTPRGN